MLGRLWTAIKNLFTPKTIIATAVIATVINPVKSKEDKEEVSHNIHNPSEDIHNFENIPIIDHQETNSHESHGRGAHGNSKEHFSKENRPKEKYVLNDTLIDEINTLGIWTAKRNEIFEGKKFRDVYHLFGIRLIHKKVINREIILNIPDSFDSRDGWGKCIHPIRNQEHCGSCWAFAATEVLSDRFCINGEDIILSPQDLLSCDFSDMGCGGGYLENSWDFMCNHGVCTENCWPYSSGQGIVEQCRDTCISSGYKKEYKCNPSSIKTFSSISRVQEDIMNNGPIEAGFEVYQDFMSYGSGVYSHHSGSLLGGHAIKVIGWGIDPIGGSYWICANSWGPTWGNLGGFFWIKRGVDECSIESNMISGLPVTEQSNLNGPVECLMCKFITGEVEKLISDGKTEQEIIKELEKACAMLGKFKNICDSLVDTYLPIIIKLLIEKETPEVVCKQLRLCV